MFRVFMSPDMTVYLCIFVYLYLYLYICKFVSPDMTATSAWFSSLSLWLSDFSCERVCKKGQISTNIDKYK